MFEEIAIKYVNQSEGTLQLIGYGLAIAGMVLAGIFHKSQSELRRAPYFAYSGLLFVLAAAGQLVWLNSFSAIMGGYLWVFMAMDIVVRLAVGYGFGVIAMARSRDAYGHARMAFLAFIPLANFWLLLTPSKNEMSLNRAPTIPLLTGGAGVLTGFVLLGVGTGLSSYITVESNRIGAEAESDPGMQQASIDMMLRGQGLEQTLAAMAAGVPAQRVDETTTLLSVQGDGTTLRYLYQVTANVDVLPISLRTGLVEGNCTHQAIWVLIQAGATLEHVYLRPDMTEIGTVVVTREICGQ